MGLEIFGSGITGEILIEDQRPDGSVILLECTPYRGRQRTAPAGAVVSSSPSGSWPMLQETGVARARHGKLHLDTTRLPGGPLRFNVSVLADRATRALSDGVRFVQLAIDNAEEWGFAGVATPDGEDGPVGDNESQPGDHPGVATKRAASPRRPDGAG